MLARTQLPDGNEYWPLDPTRVIPSIENIAHKLAQTNRYGGSCIFPYSVAQHCYLGAKALLRDGHTKETALAFLFHDAAEPLGVGDLPSPVKYGYGLNFLAWIFVKLHTRIENKILKSIVEYYGVTDFKYYLKIAKRYDRRIIADEKKRLMANSKFDWGKLPKPLGVHIEELDWKVARDQWLDLYRELTKG